MSNRIKILSGMSDSVGEVNTRLRNAVESMGLILEEQDYMSIETPILEETELFVRKSGGYMNSMLYSFVDADGKQVSLRPEFTPSIIRYFIQERNSVILPARWWYSGPVFRYDQDGTVGCRQFTQLGAELLGINGTAADLEIIELAIGTLKSIGIDNFQLKIGHIGVLNNLLNSFGLSEAARLFILANIRSLKMDTANSDLLTARAADLGIVGEITGSETSSIISEMPREVAQTLVQELLSESLQSPLGQRTAEQIVDRLLRKLAETDHPDVFSNAVRVTKEMVSIDDRPENVLKQSEKIVASCDASDDCLRELGNLADRLIDLLGDNVILDLGHVRGIAYYTGMNFDISICNGSNRVRKLGGGGRYDGLVRVLGGEENMPAAGFAYSLEQIMDCSNSDVYQPKAP